MRYADYKFYIEIYGGTLPAAEFDNIGVRASALFERLTFGRCANITPENEAYQSVRLAFCAICDELHRADTEIENGGTVVSETVGKWSRTYAQDARTSNQRFYAAAAMYLAPESGLLYRGIKP